MPDLETWLAAGARLGGWAVRWRLAREARDFVPPRRALILKPCCMTEVMLATPLLEVLTAAYPQTRFDWAVSGWAREAIVTHPALGEVLDSGRVGLPDCTMQDLREFSEQLREIDYDTCFVPGGGVGPMVAAWRAGIPQRIGLDEGGLGAAYTTRVAAPAGEATAARYLALAGALGLDGSEARMHFYPTDAQRAAAFARLTDEIGWDGQRPVVMLHPGGGANPRRGDDPDRRWPIERFALLGNHLVREKNALVLVVGEPQDEALARGVAGIMSAEVLNLAGRLNLGELGALAELAACYVGNDAGPTFIAAAVGCRTVIIYGPEESAADRPPAPEERVVALWEPYEGDFSWEKGVSVARVRAAVEGLLS